MTYNSLKGHPFYKIVDCSNVRSLLDKDIRLLSQESSSDLWESIFGVQTERRFFEKGHWFNKLNWMSSGLNWVDDYNAGISKGFEKKLLDNFPYQKSDIVFYFNDPYEAIETSWGGFSLYWTYFFELNDESYIWKLGAEDISLVTPHGGILKASLKH